MDTQNISQKTKIAAEASRMIWGYVVRSFDPDDEMTSEETAFYYSIYHYAVADILEKYGIEEEVRDIFIPSAAFLMQADVNDPRNAAAFGIMQGLVNSLLSWMKKDNYAIDSIEGVRDILGLKEIALHSFSFHSYYDNDISEYECQTYLKNVKLLRIEIDVGISQAMRTYSAKIHRGTSAPSSYKTDSYRSYSPFEGYGMLIAILAVLLSIFLVPALLSFLFSGFSSAPQSAATQTVETAPALKALTPPAHGAVIQSTVRDRVAPLTIETSGDGYYLFTLVNKNSGKVCMSFFGHAGKTFEKDVPLGKYYLYYAHGSEWYGKEEVFGENGSYAKCDDILDFTKDGDRYSGWSLTLYPVSNGNMDTTHISKASFPTSP